jgi:hypothetical protein
VVRTAVAVVKAVLLLGVRLLLAAATPLLVLVLRRLIRNRRWGFLSPCCYLHCTALCCHLPIL